MILPRLTNYVSRAAFGYLNKSSSFSTLFSWNYERNYSFTATLGSQAFPPADQILKHKLGVNLDKLTKEEVNLVFEPYAYTCSIPYKQSRPSLISALNYWMNIPDDTCKTITQLVNLTFEIAYMVDDIQDSAPYRRGSPTPHRVFGESRTMLCAISGHFVALKRLIELNNIKAAEAYLEQMLILGAGLCGEILQKETHNCPTVEEFQRVHARQVEANMAGIVKLMQAFSDYKKDLTELCKLLSMQYQAINNLSNLADEKLWGAKGFCEDIAEGKYSLAIVHAINTGTLEGNAVAAIMRQKEKDLPMLKYCHSLLVKLGSIDFATEAMLQVEKKLMQEIERLGGNPPLVEYVKAFTISGYDEGYEECNKVDGGKIAAKHRGDNC